MTKTGIYEAKSADAESLRNVNIREHNEFTETDLRQIGPTRGTFLRAHRMRIKNRVDTKHNGWPCKIATVRVDVEVSVSTRNGQGQVAYRLRVTIMRPEKNIPAVERPSNDIFSLQWGNTTVVINLTNQLSLGTRCSVLCKAFRAKHHEGHLWLRTLWRLIKWKRSQNSKDKGPNSQWTSMLAYIDMSCGVLPSKQRVLTNTHNLIKMVLAAGARRTTN